MMELVVLGGNRLFIGKGFKLGLDSYVWDVVKVI